MIAFLLQAAFAPEIVVTGRGLRQSAGDAAYDVVVIDRDRLANSASGRLEDILRDAAGFQQFRRSDSRSAQPTSQGATLRGLGGNASSRALVLLDGVPQVDPFGGWVTFTAFDPQRLSEVRVTRGGGSGVNGPGALAGTIELSSATAADLAPVFGGIAYGSRDSIDADLGVSAAPSGGFLSLTGSYARGDGFVPIVAEDRGPADRAAPYEQASVAARAVVPVGAQSELQASGLALYDARDRGIAFTPNRNVGADASLRLIGRGTWGYEALAYVQVRRFSSGFASIDETRTTVTETLDQYNVPATGLGGRIELRPPVGANVELRLGGDVRATSGETRERFSFVATLPTRRRAAGGETRSIGGFAEATVTAIPALTLTGGARIDRWRIADGRLTEALLATGVTTADTRFTDRSGWEPTARAGAALALNDELDVRAAAYLGWRLPTLNELYRPFRVGADATAANAALSPERSRGIDAGISWRPLPIARVSATAFWNRLDDAIANVTLGRGPGQFPQVGFVSGAGAFRQRQNLDAIRSRGVEVDGSVTLAPWSFGASYAYVDARVRADGLAASLDGLRPAQTPRHQASTTLGWAQDAGPRASLTARYVSRQFEDDQNARALEDAVTFDAALALPVARRLALELRAENLTDKRVEAGISGGDITERGTPRTLWVGVRFSG